MPFGVTTGAIGAGTGVLDSIGVPGVGGISDTIGDVAGGALDSIGLGGVDRSGTRTGDTKLKPVHAALKSGEIRQTGPVTIQLEYYGDAADRGDASRRAEIFSRAMQNAASGDDSGRIHNEVTAQPGQLEALGDYLTAQSDVIGWVMQGKQNFQPVQQNRGGSTQPQPGGNQQPGGNAQPSQQQVGPSNVQLMLLAAAGIAGITFLD